MGLWLLNQRVTGTFALMLNSMNVITLQYQDESIGTASGASNHVGAANNRHQLSVSAYGSGGRFRIDVERD